MTTAIDPQALSKLLDDLMKWLRAHPGEDLQDFADDHNCSIEDISDSWNTFFSGDFSKHYKIDTDYDNHYHPQPPPHGDPHALKSYIVREVNTYQQFTTVNNIDDHSFNQQIVADKVQQDIDIDNSQHIADHGGVNVDHADLEHSNVNTGDRAVVDSDHSNVNSGDVSSHADDGSTAATNINFGGGNTNTTSDDHSLTDNSDHSDNSAHHSFNTDTSDHSTHSIDDSFNHPTDVDTNTEVHSTTDNSTHTHTDSSDNSTHTIDDSFNTHPHI